MSHGGELTHLGTEVWVVMCADVAGAWRHNLDTDPIFYRPIDFSLPMASFLSLVDRSLPLTGSPSAAACRT